MAFHRDFGHKILPAVFFVSCSVIGWQLALMRCLLISHYHHFSFLVISCALLGFGASGTLLSLAGRWIETRVRTLFVWGLFGFAISMPFSLRVGELLPINVFFPPMLLVTNLLWWGIFWLIHLIPFLFAGLLIGLALVTEKKRVHTVYAVNLAGSAAGAVGTILLMWVVPANVLALPLALLVTISSLWLLERRRKIAIGVALTLGGAVLILLPTLGAGWVDQLFPLHIDEYKTLAHMERLERQQSATKVKSLHSPRGRVDLYSSPYFHTLLALSSNITPPRMDMIVKDGVRSGAVPRIQRTDEASFLLSTLSALPYKLMKPKRALILGDSGGIYLWLSRFSPADSIVLVQSDPNVVRVLREHQSNVFKDRRVQVVIAQSRAFLDSNRSEFDIIHLAELQGFAAGSSGIGGLREDYLATVEGFGKCLQALTPEGLVCVMRGIQDPPRDNIKIAATWIEALVNIGVSEPGNNLLMTRDELAMVTLVAKNPINADSIQQFRRVCKKMSWDMEWFPGVEPDETNTTHILPGPSSSHMSWYHYSLRSLLSDQRANFYNNWFLNVRPALDNQPFFHDFFRWESVSKLRAAFGPLWPARAEMGFLVLVIAAIWCMFIGAILIAVPIFVRRQTDVPLRSLGTGFVVAYFASLGTAFMFLEMTFIQMFSRFLGDHVLAAALSVGGILFFAGVGSFLQPRVTALLKGGILTVCLLIGGVIVFDLLIFGLIFELTGLAPTWLRAAIGLGLIAPLAVLMGNPFPWGLAILQQRAPGHIPLAWAVNGFASVVATSGAVLIAMSCGFKHLLEAAAVLYVFVGILSVSMKNKGMKMSMKIEDTYQTT